MSRSFLPSLDAFVLTMVLFSPANLQRYDPDVLVGHDFLTGSLEAILERMGKLKTDHWSRFGRFKRKGRPPVTNKFGGITGLMSGRLTCDLSAEGNRVSSALVLDSTPESHTSLSCCR